MTLLLIILSIGIAFFTVTSLLSAADAQQKGHLKRQVAWALWAAAMLLLTIWLSIVAAHYIPN